MHKDLSVSNPRLYKISTGLLIQGSNLGNSNLVSLMCFSFSIQYSMCFRASQGGGGQLVSSETGTPPRPQCAGLLSLTRPIFPCFLF